MRPRTKRRRNEKLLEQRWSYIDAAWEVTDALVLARRSEWYSVWLLWRAGRSDFIGYYVNFERPWSRTPIGFDTTDFTVDLIIGPDLRYEWKDRAGFEQRVDARPDHRARMPRPCSHAMGDVVSDIDAQRGVFSGDLVDWKPDPTWATPQLPSNWNDACRDRSGERRRERSCDRDHASTTSATNFWSWRRLRHSYTPSQYGA